MIYFERLKDGTIGQYTNNAEIAAQNGLNEQTTEEIIKYNGKSYLQSEHETLINSPEYKTQKAQEKQAAFEKEFFQTSYGWIRRTVTMKDGSTANFLKDCLPIIKDGISAAGIPAGILIRYKVPENFDFSKELTPELLESLQDKSALTYEQSIQFAEECRLRFLADFAGEEALNTINL